MKLLVVLAASIALCVGHAIPLIPGDNDDYVEGVSRYIWMDDDGSGPVLVDLFARDDTESPLAARNGADNAYWLFTRQNPTTAQILVVGDVDSVRNSNYDGSKPTKVIVHGWNSNGQASMNPLITEAFLHAGDVNVIVLDWRRLSNRGYFTASRGVPDVGRGLGNFLTWLLDLTGGSFDNVHLVGFSLGAHIVGNAGRTVGGRIRRITGLDPAGPTWGGNDNALTITDAQYVEAIHTDGGRLGIFDPIAQANFYPNGGRNRQPGCLISTCSHSRAPELFASSIYTNHFVAQECANLTEARRGRCSGAEFNMGNGELGKQGTGLFGVTTGRSWPF